MKRMTFLGLVLAVGLALPVLAAESPVGQWNTVDEKSGKVRSEVEVYDQDGKLFAKITAHKGGTILDPDDGKIYKAEIWTEDGKLKVRGYLGAFYRTQTWVKVH